MGAYIVPKYIFHTNILDVLEVPCLLEMLVLRLGSFHLFERLD